MRISGHHTEVLDREYAGSLCAPLTSLTEHKWSTRACLLRRVDISVDSGDKSQQGDDKWSRCQTSKEGLFNGLPVLG